VKLNQRGAVVGYLLFSVAVVVVILSAIYWRHPNPIKNAPPQQAVASRIPRSSTLPVSHVVRLQPSFIITGSLKNRAIMYKVLPAYPAWAEEQGVTGNVELAFRVNEEGAVYPNIWVTRTVGYPALEEAAVQALKHWRFAPRKEQLIEQTSGDITPEATPGQPGIIRFNFTIS
jgi:TonB family protein